MRNKTVPDMPAFLSLIIIAVCLQGIEAGSFQSFDINAALMNKTPWEKFITDYCYLFTY